jgi:ceramide glucosyltransferase
LIFTFGFLYALVLLLASGFSILGWSIFGGVTAIRFITACIGARILGDREIAKRFYLLPIRDIMSFGIWIVGYFSRNVKWRGRKLRFGNGGKMVQIE